VKLQFALLGLGLSFAAWGNNGRPASVKGQPFPELTWRRQIETRRVGGRCGATALKSPEADRGLFLTSAHCLISAQSLAHLREFFSEERRSLKERRRGTAGVDSESYADLVAAFSKKISAFEGYEAIEFVSVTAEGAEEHRDLKKSKIYIHPLHVLGLLSADDPIQAFDVAVVSTEGAWLGPTLEIATSGDLARAKEFGLFGHGEQWDGVLPPDADLDGDGVANRKDRCPQTPAQAEVNEIGCAEADAVLSAAFRVGLFTSPVSLIIGAGYWTQLADPKSPHLIELSRTGLSLEDFRHSTPGRGDSGSALTTIKRRERTFAPERILGIYHGPVGPRVVHDQLSVSARYENLTHPAHQAWLTKILKAR